MPSVAIKSADRESVERALRKHVAWLREQHPEIERIIWFGSWVNGAPTPGSDVDLCVVLSHSDKPMRDRVPDYLPFGFPVGIDLFPYTRDEFDQLRENYPRWHEAINSGVEV